MKYLTLFIILFSLLIVPSFAQESKPATQGHMQYNVNANAGIFFYTFNSSIHASAGWRFNRNHFLGVGSGLQRVEITNDADPDLNNGRVSALPLYLDYIRYVPFRKHTNSSFFFQIEAGGMAYLGTRPQKENYGHIAPLLGAKAGFDFAISPSSAITMGLGVNLGEAPTLIGVNLGLRF